MAGSYPDVPARKMAWDADGAVLVSHDQTLQTALVEASQADMTEMNDEDAINSGVEVGGGANVFRTFMIFPELREIDGVFMRGSSATDNGTAPFDTSGDTTNGLDGTWTNRIADYSPDNVVIPDWRDDITSLAASNVRGLRKQNSDGNNAFWRAFHVYGQISSAETPDRLLWFDQVTGLEYALPIDYGDVPRGSASDTVTFLRNNSASLTANTVQVTAEALYLGSGAWYTFKEGAGSFVATLSLASSIANGADSPNITIRRVIPDTEILGLHAARAYANVGSWT